MCALVCSVLLMHSNVYMLDSLPNCSCSRSATTSYHIELHSQLTATSEIGVNAVQSTCAAQWLYMYIDIDAVTFTLTQLIDILSSDEVVDTLSSKADN